MNFGEAILKCHVRSALYRKAKPDKKYWYNHTIPISKRVPIEEQDYNDWEEYDPRDHPECSAFNEMPA